MAFVSVLVLSRTTLHQSLKSLILVDVSLVHRKFHVHLLGCGPLWKPLYTATTLTIRISFCLPTSLYSPISWSSSTGTP